MFKKILIGCGLLIVLAVGGAFAFVATLSNTVDVTVTRELNAPAAKIHPLVDDLSRWPEWSFWESADPSLEYEYPGAKSGVGAIVEWTGESGVGKMETTSSDPEKGMWYDLTMYEGSNEAMTAKGAVTYEPNGEATTVTFSMRGETEGMAGKLIAMIMTPALEAAFEHNLTELGKLAEAAE